MIIRDKQYRTVWMDKNSSELNMIEQNLLPYKFQIYKSTNFKESCHAIKTMIVRGAGAIGSTAGFAMAQAALEAPVTDPITFLHEAKNEIEATRPTAQNLFYAVEKVFNAALISKEKALEVAQQIADKDADDSKKIGINGNKLINNNDAILTHCNAGSLAFTDFGTALAPIYEAKKEGKNIFVFVDETRPRNQGAKLTAWELNNENVPHTIIPDNAAAFIMSQHKIKLVIVGADRIAANGDTANKIGTLAKAIAAKEYNIPFYIAAPTSTFDSKCKSGEDIPVEIRSPEEVLYQKGITRDGREEEILVCSPGSDAYNPAFDITPAKFISGIITEKGIIQANKIEISKIL